MVGAYVALLRLLVVQVLQVSRDRATTWHEFVSWPFGRRSINADSVEDVTIGPPNAHPLARALPLPSQCGNMFCAAAVRITGQDDEIAFGESLSKESRAWVRDCVASILAA
jgi:hypothetical protein